MSELIKFLSAILFLTISLIARADDFKEIPQFSDRIVDTINLLSPEEGSQISILLKSIQDETGSQVAVLVVNTTAPEDIDQYSIRAAEAWKVGDEKKDNGVLLTFAINDRKMRIEVGYGLEGAIPDAITRRIREEIIVPHFRRNEFFLGIREGVSAIHSLIKKETPSNLGVQSSSSVSNSDSSSIGIETLIILGLIASSIFHNVLGGTLGTFLGGGLTFLFGTLFGSAAIAVIAMIIVLVISALNSGTRSGGSGMSWGGGSSSGFSSSRSSGGGFSGGGGGSFGGGGSSGSW